MTAVNIPVGREVVIDGVRMVHVGGGRFEPVEQGAEVAKRFSDSDGEPFYPAAPGFRTRSIGGGGSSDDEDE